MDYSTYLSIFILFQLVYSETIQYIPLKINPENELAQPPVLATKTKKRVHDMMPKLDFGDNIRIAKDGDLLDKYDFHSVLWITVRNKNIKKNKPIYRAMVPDHDKINNNTYELRKSSWSSCYRKSFEQCKKACCMAFKYICRTYSCSYSFKDDAKIQCRKRCKDIFMALRHSATEAL